MTTAQVHTNDVDIVYDYEGSGPLLLMIAGRGGTAQRYAGISAILRDEYTVVRYDRRCCGRSTGDKRRPMDMTQQAGDAIAVITDLGVNQAFIFGNSSGASIALRIAEYYPERVLGMIAHEPMTVSVLPDAAEWIAFNMKLEKLFHTQGVGSAMKSLSSSMIGVPSPVPNSGQPPGSHSADDAMDFFLGNEFMSLCYYRPDLERIKRNKIKLIMTKGRESGDAYYARTADVIGEGVGCPVRIMSGNHISHVGAPATFSAELRSLLEDVTASRGEIKR